MSKYKTGDKVLVTGKTKTLYWWDLYMDKFIGTINTVETAHEKYVTFVEDNRFVVKSAFPLDSIEHFEPKSVNRFEVGDIVKVIKKSDHRIWVDSLNFYLGKELKVIEVENTYSVRLSCDWNFPLDSIELVSKGATFDGKFKFGDTVKISNSFDWVGFVGKMYNYIGRTGVITKITAEFDKFNKNSPRQCVSISGAEGFMWPVECLSNDFESKPLIFNEKEEIPVKVEYAIGDKVKVVRKVTEREEGWNNVWIPQMDEYIGKEYIIDFIGTGGIYFKDDEPVQLGFPASSLELVTDRFVYTPTITEKPKKERVISYQYLIPDAMDIEHYPEFKNLCISISTEIETVGNDTQVFWAATFKNPKDKFSKVEARKALNEKTNLFLVVGKEFSRNEIVAKILCAVFYDEYSLPEHYRNFVRFKMIEALVKMGF